MTDDLLTEFRSGVPLPDDETTRRAFAHATAHPRRGVHRARRPLLAMTAAVLVFAAAAVAAVTEAPWWQGGDPPVDPQAVAMVAQDNMPARVHVDEARTVARDGDAALVAVPLDERGYCVIPAIDGHADLGASCLYQAGDLLRSATQPDDGHWIVYGRVSDPRATNLDLGAMTLGLARGGFFVADIPQDQWRALAGTATAATVRTSSGDVLESGCANWGESPGATGHQEAAFWIDPQDGKCVPQSAPERPTLDLDHATKLFDVTLTQPYSIWKAGETVTFESVPESDGRACVMATGPRLPRALQGCAGGGDEATGRPLSASTGATLAHDDGKAFYAWDVQGSTAPGAHIARVEVSSGQQTVRAALGGNAFFAQLPVTTPGPRAGTLPFPDGQWTATGYDAAGNVVARVDLDALYRAATPH